MAIGAANIHIIAWTMSAALEGEESVTASAMQAVRSLGIAFGAAISSLIVNSVGLRDITTKDEVAGAVVWIYFTDVIPAALAAIFVLRIERLQFDEVVRRVRSAIIVRSGKRRNTPDPTEVGV